MLSFNLIKIDGRSAFGRLVFCGVLFAGVIFVGCLAAAAPATPPPVAKPAPADSKAPTNDVPKVLVIPKSVFSEDLKTGRDPFFPDSERRSPKPKASPSASNNSGTSTPVPKKAPGRINLTGITGNKNRRLASINGWTFSAGETSIVRSPEGPVQITVHEIREKSVIISVEGESERRELTLR